MRRVSSLPSQMIFLGNYRDARDLKGLSESGIQAVVDFAADEPPAVLFRDIIYLRIPLLDGAGNPAPLLKLAVSSVELLIREGVTTLVACSNGMSRSPGVLAMAISRIRGCRPCDSLLGGPHDLSEGLWHDLNSVQ